MPAVPPTLTFKAFTDEPAALGRPLAWPGSGEGDADDVLRAALAAPPTDSRLYLSGTHLRADGSAISALSAIPQAPWLAPLLAVLDTREDGTPDGRAWLWPGEGGARAPDLLDTPLALWTRDLAYARLDPRRPFVDWLGRLQRRPASGSATLDRPSLHALLDLGAAVLVPVPVADGFDLSVYAPLPLRDRFAAALAAHPAPGLRRFLAPYRTTRSEARFHFDRWTPDMPLPPGVVEV